MTPIDEPPKFPSAAPPPSSCISWTSRATAAPLPMPPQAPPRSTCIIHLIRNTFRLASRNDWDALTHDVKPIYTRPPAGRGQGRPRRDDRQVGPRNTGRSCGCGTTRGKSSPFSWSLPRHPSHGPHRSRTGTIDRRWKPALSAFAITFADRWPAAKPTDEDLRKQPKRDSPVRASIKPSVVQMASPIRVGLRCVACALVRGLCGVSASTVIRVARPVHGWNRARAQRGGRTG